MTDELIIHEGLDSPIPADTTDIIARIRQSVEDAIANNDGDAALETCRQFYAGVKMAGRGLAEILYLIYTHWDKLGINDDFYDTVHREVGIHRHTVERYVGVATLLNGDFIPADLLPEIEQRNIGELIPIANAVVRQGHEFSREDWTRIAEAPDKATITKAVSEIKGQESRSNKLSLVIDRVGNIYATRAGERFYVGYLEVDNTAPSIKQACERIINNAGMLRQ